MGSLLRIRGEHAAGLLPWAVWSWLVLLLAALPLASGQERNGGVAKEAAIRSGCEVDYPPFCIVQEDGSSTGFSVELMQAALAAMGREVTFRTGPWAEVKGWLERGEIEALPLVGRTPERERLFDFTVPYLTMHGAIVVRKDATGIRSLADLRGRRVGVMRGDNAEEFLRREERGLEIVTTPTFSDAFRVLSEGGCDAVVVQRLVALRLLAESGLQNLRIVDRPIMEFGQDFCFAVREGDRDTLALLNEGLALVVADGTYRRLHAKWFARLELPTERPIVIGGDHDYPPFEFPDGKGRPTGFTVELTRAIARQMDMEVQVRLGPWDRTVEALRKGDIDAVEGMFYSSERDRALAFSPRYMVIHCVGVVRRGNGRPPATMEELTGRDLVVQAGDAILDALKERGIEARITTVETQEDVVREVAEGRHDCGLATRFGALYAVERNGWTNLEVGTHSFYSGQYCYAVRQGQDALLAQFTEGLRVLKDTGEYQRIYDKWLGTYESATRWHDVMKYVAYVAVPLLGVAVLALVWSWSLRRQVLRRTTELAALSSRHETMLSEIPDIIVEVDGRRVYTWANPAALAFFGDDLVGHEAADYFVGDQGTYGAVQPLFDGNEKLVYLESPQRRRDGETRLLAWRCRALKDGSGGVVGALSTARDITDARLAEERLRRSEALLNAAQRIAKIGGWEWDVERNEMFWTEETFRIHDLDPDEVAPDASGRIERSAQCYPEEDRARLMSAFRACAETGTSYELECRFTTARGRDLWVRTSGQAVAADGRVVRVVGDIQDITEQKQAEEELARVAREWQSTFDAARDAVWLLDRDHRVLRANRTTEQLLGRSGAELVGKHCWQIMHGMAEPFADCPVLRARHSLRRESLELPMGDRWFAVTMDPILDGAGEYAGAVHVVRDITERRLQDETVRHLNRVLRAIRNVNQLIVRERDPGRLIQAACELLVEDRSYTAALVGLTDRNGRVNRYAQAGMGTTFPPLAAWLDDGRLPPCCADAARGEGVHVVADTASVCAPCPIAAHCPGAGVICARMVHEDELLGFIAVSGSSQLGVDADEKSLFLEVAGDLAYALHTMAAHAAREEAEEAREALREQLLQAQKMESVGRLAGGVAHDFNNKLMTILGYGELCQLELPENDPLREYVDAIVETARRSAALTRQLLAFARKQAIQPEVLDLNRLVPEMLKMLQRLIGEDIQLVWRPGVNLWPVVMDPSQLDQVLANLAVNARDAIGGPGTVTVETANQIVDKSYAGKHADAVPGEYVALAVSDDGCGMGKEVLARLFEPFFTTKEVGKGTGLGLATVYGIARQNGGFITVWSELGKGSTFRVLLPRSAEGGADSDQPVGREEDIAQAAGETVLLVEDEEPLLRSTGQMLNRLGYRVLTAPSAAQALAIAEAHPAPIHVLLTDVVMPEMNGRELRDRLLALLPALRCVFMSGYTADIIAHEGVLEKGVHFLQKPFALRQLGRKLREALDSLAE